jgi:hypothetical protein
MTPYIVNGMWCNARCGSGSCSCAPLCELEFPGEVAEIRDVQVDGISLGPDMYRIDDGWKLVRQDDGCWPSCQNLRLPLGELCTFGITYVPGVKPDDYAMYAAGVLACEFAKACSTGNCRLPKGVTAVVRQGVTMTISPELWPGGLTNLTEVDALITSLNPYGHKTPPRVWSPDLPANKHRFTTWVPTIPDEEV